MAVVEVLFRPPMMSTRGIVLASSSPRRAALLRLLGVPFRIEASAVEETLGAGDPAELARHLAIAKARAVSSRRGGEMVLAADTLIAFRGRVMGKPGDGAEAAAMLRSLRGRWHRVLTGVALVDASTGAAWGACEESRVRMRRYSDSEIAEYVASGDPLDKAAAYAIQNRSFRPVERLKGCYTNVMGLPLCAVAELLGQAGIPVPNAATGLRTSACPYCRWAQEGGPPSLSPRDGSWWSSALSRESLLPPSSTCLQQD